MRFSGAIFIFHTGKTRMTGSGIGAALLEASLPDHRGQNLQMLIVIVPTLRVGMQLQTLCVCGTQSVP